MNSEAYDEVLNRAQETLSRVASNVQLLGKGAGRFLGATSGNYGIEFYAAENGFVIDPAIDHELQGEQFFPTMDEASIWAAAWLTQQNISVGRELYKAIPAKPE